MAIGYLSKALSRADPIAPVGGIAGTRAAIRSASPLAEEDQRLHDMPEVTAPSAPVLPLNEAPHEPLAAPENAAPPAAATPSQQEMLRSVGHSEQDTTSTGMGALAEPNVEPIRHAQTNPLSDQITSQTPVIGREAAGLAPAEMDTPRAPERVESPALPPTPEAVLSGALSRAEAWARGGEDADQTAAVDPLSALFEPTHAPSSQPGQTSGVVSADIEPILPAQFQMQSETPPPPAAAQVEIGSIEVEIVPAPRAAKPQQPAPKRSQPVTPSRVSAAPYGWRQR